MFSQIGAIDRKVKFGGRSAPRGFIPLALDGMLNGGTGSIVIPSIDEYLRELELAAAIARTQIGCSLIKFYRVILVSFLLGQVTKAIECPRRFIVDGYRFFITFPRLPVLTHIRANVPRIIPYAGRTGLFLLGGQKLFLRLFLFIHVRESGGPGKVGEHFHH